MATGDSGTRYVRLYSISLLTIGAVNVVRPAAVYEAIGLGSSVFELGVLASSYALLAVLVAVPLGRWVDRGGASQFVLVGPLLIASACALIVITQSFLWLLVAQSILGLGHVLTAVSIQTTVGNSSTDGERVGRYGHYSVAVSLGQFAGPAIFGASVSATAGADGGAVDGSLAFALAGILALGAAGLSLAERSSPAFRPRPLERATGARSKSPFAALFLPGMVQAMTASVVVLCSVDIMVAYLPAYGEQNGVPVHLIAALLSVRAAASLISRLSMSRLVEALGATHVLVGSMWLAASGLVLLPFLAHPAMLFVIVGLVGVGLGLGQPLTMAWVAQLAPADMRGAALGTRLAGNRTGQVALPTLLGALGGAIGLAAIFWALATALAGGGAFALRSTARNDARATGP